MIRSASAIEGWRAKEKLPPLAGRVLLPPRSNMAWENRIRKIEKRRCWREARQFNSSID